MDKWDDRFIHLAREVSTWSKVLHSQQGCVAVSPSKRQFTVGYNGLPSNYPDRKMDISNTIHAEVNCIINAKRALDGWTLYVTKAPCLDCAKVIASAGITKLWSPRPEGSWKASQTEASKLLKVCGIIQYTYGEQND